MRLVSIYLTCYFLLVLGALVALWTGGVLQHLPVLWVIIGLAIAVGLGMLLALTMRRATTIPNP